MQLFICLRIQMSVCWSPKFPHITLVLNPPRHDNILARWPQPSPENYWVRFSLPWRHNEVDSVSNYQPHDCLLNLLFRQRSKKISKLCVTGFCEGNSPVTGKFPAQRASNAENGSIRWRHHVFCHGELRSMLSNLQHCSTPRMTRKQLARWISVSVRSLQRL